MGITFFTIAGVIVVVVLAAAIVALIVWSMRNKTRQDDRVRAEQLRTHADERAAAVLPDAQVRAERAAAEAEEARKAAEAAETAAAQAQVEVAQQEAAHEDLVRAADRLDPDVDHQADGYTPQAAERLEDPDTIFDESSTPPADAESAPASEAPADPPTRSDEPTPGRPPLGSLPRRTPGAQEMPGTVTDSDGWTGSLFKKRDPGSSDNA